MSRISLDAAGQKTVNFQDAIMAHGYELWLQMSPTPHMAANYQCQYKISETLLNSCVWHARGLCIFVSLPKNFAVVNYTTYYLQTSSVHHQCTGDSLVNYPYTLLIIKSLHYAMVSGYHTRNENKSYYHSSHKSKSVSWNRSSSISYTKMWYNLAWSGPLHSDWHLCTKRHLVSKFSMFHHANHPQKKLDQIQGWW